MQSMTGFSEKRFSSKAFSAKVSIRSLNHRYLDWNYNGSRIGEVENRLRSICQEKVHRGRIDVYLELKFLDQSSWNIDINENLLEKLFFSLERSLSKLSKPLNFSVENLFKIPQVIEIRRKDFTKEEIAFLEKSFVRTLEEVLQQRKREGQEVGKIIKDNVLKIKQAVKRIEKLAQKQPLLIKNKLRQRLKELTKDAPLLEEKLAEEAAYYAQKYDITEEISRLKSHLNYTEQLLSSPKPEPKGRKLEFIAQEIYRETNTIGSKSQDTGITQEALTIKGELESIRQQIQNIE
ncbi:MAG: YicC family protein [Candidatus Aminicenantes bacterium]|nr:YicC family protein [Candidatus Aminicenantes bacterium]